MNAWNLHAMEEELHFLEMNYHPLTPGLLKKYKAFLKNVHQPPGTGALEN